MLAGEERDPQVEGQILTGVVLDGGRSCFSGLMSCFKKQTLLLSSK